MSYLLFPNPTPVFPALRSLGWSVHKKPILSSRVIIAATGREVQHATAGYPRWEFTLTYGWLSDQTQNIVPDPTLLGFTELEQIIGIFLACLGPYGEFFYTDADDSSRTGQFVATGDGTTVSFPVYYNWGTGPFSPPMSIPVGGVNAIGTVYLNGTPVSATTYSIDTATRTILTFTSPPAAGAAITMDFSFYYRCRFLDDHIDFTQFVQNKWEAKEIRFESVKV